jgi:hypothetical protein
MGCSLSSNPNTFGKESYGKYYVCNSSDNKNFYLLNNSFSLCTCKAYKYCKKEIKSCKHLKSVILELNSTEKHCNLPVIDLNKKICTCNDYNVTQNCKHVEYFQ